jgi:hypothetical protein
LAAVEAQPVLARSQLETALAHDEDCLEAQILLDSMQQKREITVALLGQVFSPRDTRRSEQRQAVRSGQ